MNSNITTSLLSFVPMLKKFFKISCYMGLFFVASVSYAADNFESYSVGTVNAVTSDVWNQKNNFTGTDAWQIVSSPVYSGARSLACFGSGNDCDYATTSYSGGTSIYSQSIQVFFSTYITRATFGLSDSIYSEDSQIKAGLGYGNCVSGSTDWRFYVDGSGTDCSDFDDVGLSQYSKVPVNEWITIQIAYDFYHNEVQARWISVGTTTPWLTASIGISNFVPLIEMVYSQYGGDIWIDDWNIFATSTENTFVACPTCTRIVSHTPDRGETFPEVTDIPIFASVYVASSDVINEANIYTKFQWSSVKGLSEYSGVGYGENDPQPSGVHKEHIFVFDEEYQTFPRLFDFDFATGTYKMKIDIIEEVYPPWWQFWNDTFTEKVLATEDYEFYVLQPTDYAELEQMANQVILQQELQAANDACAREGFVSQACFMVYSKELLDSIMYAPPHGYAFLLAHKLMATTTGTSSIAMLVSFPEGSPLRGHTLDLNMSSALGNSIIYIDSQDIETLPDGAMNTFMKYWNYFCYIMLGLWIVREVFGTFSIDFSYNANAGNYQRKGNIPVRSAHGKGLKITSYD